MVQKIIKKQRAEKCILTYKEIHYTKQVNDKLVTIEGM